MTIDVKEWRDFRVGDLFTVRLSSDDLQPKNLNEGDMPLVSSGMNNNGICAMVDETIAAERFRGGSVTVDMFGKAFYQPDDYFAVSHGRVNILEYARPLSSEQGLFIQSVFDAVLNGKYSYSLMCTSKKLADEIVKLPVTSNGEPDWDYMEQYMRDVMARQADVIDHLARISKEKHPVPMRSWGGFHVGELFEIHPTKAYKMTNADLLDNGKYPVVVNSGRDNGIGGYTSQIPTEAGNMITFSDTTDATTIFYQPEPFVGYPHVQGLYPIGEYVDKWSETSLLFFATLFRATALNMGFDYGNKFRRDIAASLRVYMPVTESGEPDWVYMEDYMRQVMDRQAYVVDCLKKISTRKAG